MILQRVEDIAPGISNILEKRRTHLPQVQGEIERWRRVDSDVERLEVVVRELHDHARTPLEVKQALAGFQMEDVRKGIAAALDQLRVLEARYARGTINIGVSGRARVGKSTMLQSVSGLTDQQIPTGQGLPVTAVRSRIFHSSNHQRATLLLHSFDTFRDDVLRPYHDELGLPGIPVSVEEFRLWSYPSDEELRSDIRAQHSSVTMLRRVREMQQALWSYKNDLIGSERTIDLAELRQYVAYPTNDEIASERCPRRYLAVRDVCIECDFPHAQVDHLGIIDLPGLGELAANAEEYHLIGLQNEVDVVILVKRPVEGMAYWGREDGNATNLLDRARGYIKNRRDFVFVAINSGGADPTLATSLRDDIRRQVNDGADGKHFHVLEVDAADQRSVYENVLMPVLSHLTNRLSVMDTEVLEGTRARYAALSVRILTALKELESELGVVSRTVGSTAEDVERQTVELRKDLAAALADLVATLQTKARAGEEDPAFLAAIDLAYDDIHTWISSGFGKGKEAWCKDALRTMRVDRNSSPFTAEEFNRIRVEISHRYCSLDNYFRECVDKLWNDVGKLLASNLGVLLEEQSGELTLRQLANLLNDASEPCHTLSEAIEGLLALRLEYRTHLHPLVRRELDGLNLQVTDPVSGEPKDQIVVDVSESGAEKLYRVLSQLAEQAAYYTKKALMDKALTPALVLHAAAEQFEDALIRSGDSEREFRRFARSYRDELWPGVYQGIDEANARYAKVMKAIRTIRDDFKGIERGQA